MFYGFLKLQYQLQKITKEQLYTYVPVFITQEQADEICGGA